MTEQQQHGCWKKSDAGYVTNTEQVLNKFEEVFVFLVILFVTIIAFSINVNKFEEVFVFLVILFVAVLLLALMIY